MTNLLLTKCNLKTLFPVFTLIRFAFNQTIVLFNLSQTKRLAGRLKTRKAHVMVTTMHFILILWKYNHADFLAFHRPVSRPLLTLS